MYDLAALDSSLSGTIFAGKLHYAPTTASTNCDAWLLRTVPRRTAQSTSPTSNSPAADAADTHGSPPPAKDSM